MRREDKEYLDMFARGMRIELRANKDITDLVHKAVLKQNDKISKLEEQTSFIRIIQRNPLISIPIILVGLSVLIAIVDLIGIVNILK